MILAILLMLTGVLGVAPSPVQAGQVLAAQLPAGAVSPLPEQAASVLVEASARALTIPAG